MVSRIIRILVGLLIPCFEGTVRFISRLYSRQRSYFRSRRSWREPFYQAGLDQAEKFLAIEGVRVTGHGWKCQRHVSRLEIHFPAGAKTFFIKKEAPRSWLKRIWQGESSLVGEARILMDLEREGLPVPRWVAYGQNSRGEHFLLVEELPDTVPLKSYILEHPSRVQKKEVLRRLVWTVARAHFLGYSHEDLYPKHILVDPETRKIFLLDWQRTKRGPGSSWKKRGNNLARFHATIGEEVLTLRERLALLSEYFAALAHFGANPGDFPFLLSFAYKIEQEASQLLKRRHIREKRFGRSPTQTQDWIHLEGENFRVTSTCDEGWLKEVRCWLENFNRTGQLQGCDYKNMPLGQGTMRVQWTRIPPWHSWWNALLGKSADPSEEHSQAAALYALQRQSVETGKVLSLGIHKAADGISYSFLATHLPAGSISLEEWFSSKNRCGQMVTRRKIISQMGQLLARIHQVGYCLAPGAKLKLRVDADKERLLLESAEGMNRCRAKSPKQENHDRKKLKRHLISLGTEAWEINFYRQAYLNEQQQEKVGQAMVVPQLSIQGETKVATATPSPLPNRADNSKEPARQGESLLTRIATEGRITREFATPDWIAHMGPDWSERILDLGVTDRFHAKQGRSVGRLILPSGPGRPRVGVYLKRHYKVPWWDALLGKIFKKRLNTPGLQEWQHLETAKHMGLNVPQVEAVVEYSGPGLRLQSALAVRELDGMLALHEAIPLASTRLGPREFRFWKKTLAAEMARMVRILHQDKWFHKDLYLCHFYIAEEYTWKMPNWRNQVWLIDLHRLARHPFTWRIWWIKDMAQILYSSELEEIDDRDRLAFWQAYREPGPRSFLERWMLRVIRIKWGRYRKHNGKRRAA